MSDNKPLLWVLGGGAFAFVAVTAYWIFALTLANQMKSDLIPPDKAAAYVHALIEANRKNYTENVVNKLHQAGLAEAIEHWKDERGVPLPAQFLLETGRLHAALLEPRLELGLQESVRSAVRAGYGVTFISRSAILPRRIDSAISSSVQALPGSSLKRSD